MSAAPKIAAEVAEAEFDRWAQTNELETKFSSITSEEDLKSFEGQKRIFVDAIMAGHLTVNDAGEAVFTPRASSEKDPIRFVEPDGGMIQQVDKAQAQEGVKKTYLLMAAISGQDKGRFLRMKQRDLSVCGAVVGLLMAR